MAKSEPKYRIHRSEKFSWALFDEDGHPVRTGMDRDEARRHLKRLSQRPAPDVKK